MPNGPNNLNINWYKMNKMKQLEYDTPEIFILRVEFNDVLCDSTGTNAGIDDLTEQTIEW